MLHSSCDESWCAIDQTPLSQQTLYVWVIWSVTHSLSNPGPSYPNSAGEQGEEIEFTPSKTGLQIPINRNLESLQFIKFHLPRWSGQSGSSFYTQCVGMHEHTRKHVRMHMGGEARLTHALKLTHKITCTKINTHTIKQIQIHTHAHTRTQSYTPPLTPALASTINNLGHCGAYDPVTFNLWS